MFKLGMENKQYEISFEVVISLQTKLQFQNFPHAFFLSFLDFKKIQVHGSLNN
jgi:hypothetical protein